MNKKHISLMLAALMCFTSIIPSFAYDLDEKGNSIEEVEYQNTEDEDYTNQTNVFAEIGSEYKVTIPKTIVLSGVTKSADYYVKVEGDIAGYETVNVVPDENVVLYTKNKASQTGIITQDKTSWKISDFNVNANGKVSADGLTAGKWSGVFNFYINMDSHEELVLGDIVLPPIDFDSTSPAQTNGEMVNLKVGEAGNINITYDNKDVANDAAITSSNENVVKVNKNKLTAVNEGTSTITVDYDTSKFGIDNGVKSYSFNVKVTKEVAEKKLTVDTNGLAMGANSSYEVHAFYDGEDVTNEIDWSSDNNKITVNKGVVMTSATAKVGDTATITASMSDDTSGLVAALDKMGIIAVASAEDGDDSVSFKVTIVEINFDDSEGAEIDEISILPGEHKSIKAKITPETTGTVAWSSTAPSGVTLQKKGNDVTIYVANDMPEGRTYNVIATYGDYSKPITLTIASKTKDNLSVSIEDGNALTVGDVKDINVTTTDNTTPSNVTITSSDESVAKIVDGKIEAVGAGEATITISANGSVSKTINIIVEEAKIFGAGLYDANNKLIITWDDMVKATGFNIGSKYSYSAGFYKLVEKKYPNVRKVVIPEGIEGIGDDAFSGCSCVEEIIIPDSVTKINIGAFYGCASIESIGPKGSGADVEIPSSVTSIEQLTFKNCTSLKSVEMPDSITKISREAFGGCTSLETIVIPDSVTTIENVAFSGCASLKSVKLPSSVTTIGSGAFNNCGFESIGPEGSGCDFEIPSSMTTIYNSMFTNCVKLKSVELPDSITTIEVAAFNGCTSLKSVKLPNSITVIKNSFNNCGFESIGPEGSGADVEIPSSITTINNMFANCAELKSVELPDSVTTIEKEAFKNCTSLKSIKLPNSITSLNDSVFSGCTSITSIGPEGSGCDFEIPSSMIGIGRYTFTNCTALESIEIPDSITYIGETVFYNCTALKFITFNSPSIRFSSSTFNECKSINSIIYKNTKTKWNSMTKNMKFNSRFTVHCTDGDISY